MKIISLAGRSIAEVSIKASKNFPVMTRGSHDWNLSSGVTQFYLFAKCF